MADNDDANIGQPSGDGGNAVAPTNQSGEGVLELSASPPTPRVVLTLTPAPQSAAPQAAMPVGETATPPTPRVQAPQAPMPTSQGTSGK